MTPMNPHISTLVIIALSFFQAVLSNPLGTKPLTRPTSDEEKHRKALVDEATLLGHDSLVKADYALKHPNVPIHKAMIDAAFGAHPSLDLRKIKKNVGRMRTAAAIPVSYELDTTAPGTYGSTTYTDANKPSHVAFTEKFYSKKTSTSARAATVIHEASHYLADTGDMAINGNIIPNSQTGNRGERMYTTGHEPYKTPAQLNGDARWVKLRDGHSVLFSSPVPPIGNMHAAAESYAQLASMCAHAITDEQAGIRHRRAIQERDWDEVAAHLMRRQACSLANRKATKGKVSSRMSSAKSGKKSVLTKPRAVIKSKTGPKSRSEVIVGNAKSNSQSLSKGRTTKGIAQGLGSVRASASVKRPQLKVSASKSSVKTSQAPKRIVGRPVSNAPAKSSSKSSLRPVPKSSLITVAKSSAKRTVPSKAVVPKVVPKQVGTQKKVRRDLTSRF